MIKSPQAKGKNFEYEVRDFIRGYGFKDTQRSPMSGAIHFLKGDIISKRFPYFIECKKTEKTDFIRWYKKAEKQSGAKPPIIIWSRNYEDKYCFLLFSDLMTLLTEGFTMKEQFKKKNEKHKLDLEETANLKFNKKHQVRKANKNKETKNKPY